MARDSQTKQSTKKELSKRSKKLEEQNRKKKRGAADSDSGSSDEGSETDSSEEMDVHEYRKFISKIFPSKHINKKIKAGEKLKKAMKEAESDSDEDVQPRKSSKKHKKIIHDDDEDSESEEEKISKKSKKNKKPLKSKKTKSTGKKVEVSDDEDDDEISLGSQDTEDSEDYDDDEEYDEEDDEESEWETVDEDEEDDEEEEVYEKPGKGKVNIIFTIGGVSEDDDEEEWEDDEDYDSDYDDSENETEDEDEEVSTDEDDEDEDIEDEEEESSEPVKKSRRVSKQLSKNTKNSKKIENKTNTKEKEDKTKEKDKTDTTTKENKSTETYEQLKKLLEANPQDKAIKKMIDVYEKETKLQKIKLAKKEKKQKAKNLRIFKKIIKDKNTMNDFSFYEKMELDNQKKIIKELREINKITRIEKPYRMTLLESTIPVEFKSAAMKKINSLRYMEPGSGEFYKSKNWVDTFMRIPFNKYEGLPVSIDNGVEKCHEFMENAQRTLEEAVYGLNDAKMQIMQMLGQLLTNPNAIGAAIAIHGPPGTGKTSLVKEGISKILNRPFAFIALGGATDSSFLEGHGYTYEGSTWGKIVQILIDSKCMNPVIYFDELDKISDTPKGEEIAGILTHLTDTSQNSQFHDKYFAEIDFDLSKCLFIFSYNDENKVNPILKDRMYRIKTKGYIAKEKTIIATNYLLPRIREQVRFTSDDIIIPNDVLSHIIETHCNKEDGVRNLKRCLEIIYTKLNLYRLMKPGSNLFEGEMSLIVAFPFNVTKAIVDKLIKREDDSLATWRNLYN
jgi:ATP-dependent Lon protease